MVLSSPIDPHGFLKSGHARSSLPRPLADMLLRSLGKLAYEDMPADHCDAGSRCRGVLEQTPAVESVVSNLWSRIAAEDLNGLLEHFRAPASRFVPTVIRLGDGYALDWHNHLAARPTASLLIYLFENGDAGQGGELVLGELGQDMRKIGEICRYKPAHGDAILIGDMTHPLLMHRAETWRGSGYRYLLSLALNAEDW